MEFKKLNKINDFLWQIPQMGEMRVEGLIYADDVLIKEMDEMVIKQVINVATLPGIQKVSLAMPDAHWGYGFCIGGVAAFDAEENGVISVGGVGFDINCGVRTIKTNLFKSDLENYSDKLADELFNSIPAGLGSRGKIALSKTEVNNVLTKGAEWAVQNGYGGKEDLEYTEEKGRVDFADPSCVSEIAIKRERGEIGTLGSGNHYLEVQYVDKIYNQELAQVFDLKENQVIITLHCGSRALGHQIGTDYLKILAEAIRKYKIKIPDYELVCAPINSPEGKKYFSACCCAINYAFSNRQILTHLIRLSFKKFFPQSNLKVLYDIGHNTCKIESHKIDGRIKKVYVHRKGATRSFGPGRVELPSAYQKTGQPVIIGGTMGTSSFILAGSSESEEKTFASVCHGAGRIMSRQKAKKTWRGENLIKELKQKGIIVRAHSLPGLAEESPKAYKDVERVVKVIHKAKLAKLVVRARPLICIKG